MDRREPEPPDRRTIIKKSPKEKEADKCCALSLRSQEMRKARDTRTRLESNARPIAIIIIL